MTQVLLVAVEGAPLPPGEVAAALWPVAGGARTAMVVSDLSCRVAPLRLAPPELEAEQLTPRELEVMRLYALGGGEVAVRAHIGCDAKTLRNHVGEAARKLHGSGAAGALLRALQLGLVEVPA